MDKEFVLVIAELYRKFKEKDRSVALFRHFLACLALKYIYDTRRLPEGPVPEKKLPRQLLTLFRNSPPAAVAPVLDEIIAHLIAEGSEGIKNVFAGISFTTWVAKDDKGLRPGRLHGLAEELGYLSFGDNAAAVRSKGANIGYLLEKYAEENFHKGGFLYTPRSLATLMVRLANPSADSTVYDPACGLGNLLVQAAKEASVPACSLYGADPDDQYRGLAHFNLFFNGLCPARIAAKDSLAEIRKTRQPAGTYDCVLLHPPFGDAPLLPAQPEGLPLLFNGTAPAKSRRARTTVGTDEDFLSLLLRSLNAEGRAAMIVPHGVLFKMGSAYLVRKLLVDHNLVEAVIDLPPNIFYSCKTNVAILVFDKAKSHADILFVDASALFEPDRRRNKMRSHHIDTLTQIHRDYASADGLASRVPVSALQEEPHDYNLTPKRYVQGGAAPSGPDLCRLRKEMEDLDRRLDQVHQQLEGHINALLGAG